MIEIDKKSTVAVSEQLLSQLRFEVVTGKYPIGYKMLSTRKLGDQLGISFHTVRKVYHLLEEEGLLTSKEGRSFKVVARIPLEKPERLERGAEIVKEAMHKLAGLGLSDDEMEYLFDEQMIEMEELSKRSNVVFCGMYKEVAESCSKIVGETLQRKIPGITFKQLQKHADADYIITSFENVGKVMLEVPDADVIGVHVVLDANALDGISRMIPADTLLLITKYVDAIPFLLQKIRAQTGFTGQFIATPADAEKTTFAQFISQSELIVYSPQSYRTIRKYLDETKNLALVPTIPSEDLARLRLVIPV